MSARNTSNTEHYTWGDGCEGWRLVDLQELSVIEERMPPGTSERLHHHERAHQYFHVLAGEAAFDVEGTRMVVAAGQGVYIAPGQRHRVRNESAVDLRFVLTSAPTTRGDRIDAS